MQINFEQMMHITLIVHEMMQEFHIYMINLADTWVL